MSPQTGLKSHRDHQHHDPCALGLSERHETLVPVRSDALKARSHGVRHRLRVAGASISTVAITWPSSAASPHRDRVRGRAPAVSAALAMIVRWLSS